jgi:DNA-binding CsgD family transcriptional regulator
LKSLDLIGAIELAYDRTNDESTWLAEVTRLIAPAYGTNGAPVTSYVFDLRSQFAVDLGTTAMAGSDQPYKREDYERAHEIGGQHVPLARVYECDPYTLLSRVVGADLAKEAINGGGMGGADAVGLRANATPTSGVIVTTQVALGHRLRSRELWTRFAAHLGTALRLRRSKNEASPDSAPAVLLPSGRLEHGNAETVAAATALAGAAKAMDRARGKLRRLDPEAAAALWRTMVSGEWSLVDWYDHDGKRFLLAQENQIPGPTNRALTRREEQVVACAAMGHSNKLIAYDLGLSTGTVAVLLGRAARKLGVSGRVSLVRAFRESYGA